MNVVSPVDIDRLEQLLIETKYERRKREKLIKQFKYGFELGYEGDRNIVREANNLKLTVGSKIEIWNKIMKEVKEKRYAGPYKNPPFSKYIQSPIGLVPKDNGKATRLIFHLSHPRLINGKRVKLSINANTPEEVTSVSYPDFDEAIKICLRAGKGCTIGKSDLKSAFRHLGIRPEDWCLLIMKAESPFDGNFYYFVDKCLPFGASISCAHFQSFSDALSHIVSVKSQSPNVNYLDDFLFAALFKLICDQQIQIFLNTCREINFPVSLEKTYWGTNRLTFLGLLIDTINQLVIIPADKIERALDMINHVILKKKATVLQVQRLCGLLNFFSRCIIPARAFTRRLYNMTALQTSQLQKHHHISISRDVRLDLEMWQVFLRSPMSYARPFADFSKTYLAVDINLFTDSSANKKLGCGGICGDQWFKYMWNEAFMINKKPSINYLELYAVTIGVLLWAHKFTGMKIALFCDNMSVVNMINNTSSSCKNCMVLIRIIVLQGLLFNVRITAKHVPGVQNKLADFLSRNKMKQFWDEAKGKFCDTPCTVPEAMTDMTALWVN